MHAWSRSAVVFMAVVSAALARAVAAPPPQDWRLFAETRLDARGLDVDGGAIGANERLSMTRALRAPHTTVAADDVVLDPASSCVALFANRGDAVAGCGPRVALATPVLAAPPPPCLPTAPAAGCDGSRPIVVAHDEERRLSPGAYGTLVVAGGGRGPGRLLLEGGEYRFCTVRIGRNAGLLAIAPSDVRVAGDVWIDNGARVGALDGPEATCAIRLHADGARLRVSRHATVSGTLCAPAAHAELRADARIHGTIYARAIRSDRVHVGACAVESTTTTTTGPSSTTTTTASSSSSSTTRPSATTTTAAPTTTATTSTSTSTTAPPCSNLPTAMDFATRASGGSCGETLTSIGGAVLKDLVCGSLAIGGGRSTIVDALTPAGLNNRFALACEGTICTVSGAAGAGGADCTMPGCPFGTPLAIANGGLSTCVGNSFAGSPSGAVDLGIGEIQLAVPLTSRVVLTGKDEQPCPVCRTNSIAGSFCAGTPEAPCAGVCEGGANQGAPCTSINATGLSRDCPAPAATVSGNVCFKGPTPGTRCGGAPDCGGGSCAQFLGDLPITLSPLTTESVELVADASGLFCPGQARSQSGAFRSGLCVGGSADGSACADSTDCPGGTCRFGKICDGGDADRKPCAFSSECPLAHCVEVGTLARVIRMRGRRMAPGCTLDTPRDVTLVSVFCIPLTSNILVNGAASLPGPGATSLPGTITLRR